MNIISVWPNLTISISNHLCFSSLLLHLVSQVYYVALVVGQTVKVFIGSILGLISYQTCGDHLLKPLGLRLVIKVDTAHQIVSCYKEYKKKDLKYGLQKCLCQLCFIFSPVGGAGAQLLTHRGGSVSTHVQYLFHFSQQMRLSQTVQTIWTDSEFHYDNMSHDKGKDLICPFINVTACILPTTQTHTNHLGDSIREEMMLITLLFRGSSAPLNVCWHTCYFILFTLMLCSTFRWRRPFRVSHNLTDPHQCDCWYEVSLFPDTYRTESHD